MIDFCLSSYLSFYEETGEPTEYFWQIDRKIQFGEFSSSFAVGKTARATSKLETLKRNINIDIDFDLRKLILGIKQQEEEQKSKVEFPPCNVEYKADTETTRFWCTTVSHRFQVNYKRTSLFGCFQQSGGIERDWAGYPIQLFNQDDKTFTCVCAKKENFDLPQFRPYENCDDSTRSCIKQTEEQEQNNDD